MNMRFEVVATTAAMFAGFAFISMRAVKQANKFRAEDRAYAVVLANAATIKTDTIKSEVLKVNDEVASLKSTIQAMRNEIAAATGGIVIKLDTIHESVIAKVELEHELNVPKYKPLPPDVETKIIKK